ncbi:hypothetical protein QM012_005507 [Aureobasidium pullulans]|uniref:Uncharacterized protein n=1 Tax=Aureobasidium pullulans TaxID=5580 RepID=A0ABR0T4X4_AURPU
MASEPSSPAFVDPQARLRQEIKDLKEKLDQRDDSFLYYEISNSKLEDQVENQIFQLEQKDLTIAKLKAHIEAHKQEHEETQQENQKLRRQSSHFEQIVKANEKELRNLPELERTIEDREAEVRNFTAELNATRTERDDKITETKGLEGDIAELRQELEAKDEEIDILYEKLCIFEHHITISKDLPAEELDDVLYEFMEKWSAIQADGSFSSPSNKKNKRASSSGMNLADEFEALSDDGYDSEDGGYGSDDHSMRSFMSKRPAKRKIQQALGMSEIESVAIHPSIKKPVEMTSMSPKPMPQNINNGTLTIPAPVSETASAETQTSPITSPKKNFTQVLSNGVQTSPIAPAAKQRKPFSEVMTDGAQTSPVAASATRIASPPKSFTLSGTSSGVSTNPFAPSPKTTTTEAVVSSPSDISVPPSSASNSTITTKPPTHTKSPFLNEVTEDQLGINDTSPLQPTKPHRINTLNIKRPRVPTKNMSPQTLSHYTSITSPSFSTSSPSSSPAKPSPSASCLDLLTCIITSFFNFFHTRLTLDILTNSRLLLLCLLTSFLGTSLGWYLISCFEEYPWAHVNGYAPEGRWIYVGREGVRGLSAIIWGVGSWVWKWLFGGWVVGEGGRLPLSLG